MVTLPINESPMGRLYITLNGHSKNVTRSTKTVRQALRGAHTSLRPIRLQRETYVVYWDLIEILRPFGNWFCIVS